MNFLLFFQNIFFAIYRYFIFFSYKILQVLSSFEFKQLVDQVHERLKARNAASGGEEMLRLRAYEKLQNLVSRGMVKKTGKKYKGLASLAKALTPDPIPVPAAK